MDDGEGIPLIVIRVIEAQTQVLGWECRLARGTDERRGIRFKTRAGTPEGAATTLVAGGSTDTIWARHGAAGEAGQAARAPGPQRSPAAWWVDAGARVATTGAGEAHLTQRSHSHA